MKFYEKLNLFPSCGSPSLKVICYFYRFIIHYVMILLQTHFNYSIIGLRLHDFSNLSIILEFHIFRQNYFKCS